MGLIVDRDAFIIAREYNFADVEPLKYDGYFIENDDMVFRFADGTNRVNCLFLVDTDDLIPP